MSELSLLKAHARPPRLAPLPRRTGINLAAESMLQDVSPLTGLRAVPWTGTTG